METAISFGQWLKKRRRGMDMTQVELANRSGCAQVTIKKLEADQMRPSKQLAEVVMRQLGVELQELDAFVRFARSGLEPEPISLIHPKNNLPAELTSFIGRGDQITEVKRTIRTQRLVTLTGAGGAGKSRLSIKVAYGLLDEFPDGVWLIELAPLTDGNLIPQTIISCLSLSIGTSRPALQVLCDYLHQKKILLVLDNCEHLIEDCAKLAEILLKAAPGLKITASSREALGVPGEATWYVPSLSLPDILNPPKVDQLSHYEAVQLFIERARLVQPNFHVINDNAPALAQICHRLDGIPLAIELAAAKVSILSVEQIASRLDDCFHLLSGGSRTALERHQTLRTTLDWSYNLLSHEEQTLFRRLSIFVNGWTLEAAEAVCCDGSDSRTCRENILNLLEHLVNKSLVSAKTCQSETRYRLLETVRQYASEKLVQAGEGNNRRDLHLEYYLNLAETAEPHLVRSEQLEWLARLDIEHDNIRAALKWSLGKNAPEQALRLSAAMGKFWDIRCHVLEGAKWLESALAMPAQDVMDSERIARVRALYKDASLADITDDLGRLKRSAEASLTLCETLEEPRDLAVARFYMGVAHFRYNEITEAIKSFERCLEEFRLVGDLYWEAWSQRMLSIIYNHIGEKKMSDFFTRDIEAARKCGERYLIAWILSDQALACLSMNKLDEVSAYIQECEAIYDQLGNRPGHFYVAKSQIAFVREDHEQAKRTLIESIEQTKLIGEQNWQAVMLQNLGVLERDEGNYKQAQIYAEEAVRLTEVMGDKGLLGGRYVLLGQVKYFQGDIYGAKENFIKGITCAKEIDYPSFRLGPLFAVSTIFATLNPVNSARILSAWRAFARNKSLAISERVNGYYEMAIAHMRQRLDEYEFNKAWVEGEKMSLDEALDLALKTLDEM